MELSREKCAIESPGAGQEACFAVLAAETGHRPTGPDESRKAPWQLSGRPTPDASLQTARVSTQPFTVGRNPDNDFCVANPTVSKRHAELVLTEGGLRVRDLGSTNGTFLNGQRVRDLERVQDGDRLQFGSTLFTVRRCGQAQAMATVSEDMGDLVQAFTQFDKLLNGPAVEPYFQPIVRFGDRRRVGFEVLARSRLPGLETAAQMFHVAAELDMEEELSRLMRREGVRIGRTLGTGERLYLNTHPAEIRSPKLLDSLAELRKEFPDAAIVLEVHEAAVTSLSLLASLRARCDELEIRLAYDDFGAGQSRLLELAEVPPHVIKFDIHMIHGIANFSHERRQMVQSLVKIVRSLDVAPLAEGVETAEEAAACEDVGFELAQGYFFGRPAPAKAWLAPLDRR